MEEYEIIGKSLLRIDEIEKAAVANPVYDAIGIRFTKLRIAPEKVLEALWKE